MWGSVVYVIQGIFPDFSGVRNIIYSTEQLRFRGEEARSRARMKVAEMGKDA